MKHVERWWWWWMMMDFLKYKKKGKKDFCNLPKGYKIIINERDVFVRKSKRVQYTLLKLYENKRRAWKSHQRHPHNVQGAFLVQISPSVLCLDELRKQQVINKKVYYQKLMDDTLIKLAWDRLQNSMVMDGDTMINRRTGEVLGPEVDSMNWNNKF